MVVRYKATITLGLLADPQAIEALIERFGHEEHDVAREAGIALKEIGDETLPFIVNVALTDENSRKRSYAVLALDNFNGSVVEETLFKCLKDPDDWVRYRAVSGTARIGYTAAVEPLIKIINENFPQVPSVEQFSIKLLLKRAAAKSIGIIGDKAASKALVKALYDKDVYLAEEAAQAIGLLNDIHSINPLIEALQTIQSNSVRHYIVQALSNLGEDAKQPIRLAIRDANPNIRFGAAMVLGNIGDVSDITELQWLPENDNGETFSHGKVSTAARKAIKRIRARMDENVAEHNLEMT